MEADRITALSEPRRHRLFEEQSAPTRPPSHLTACDGATETAELVWNIGHPDCLEFGLDAF
jgi:hypothetical protein